MFFFLALTSSFLRERFFPSRAIIPYTRSFPWLLSRECRVEIKKRDRPREEEKCEKIDVSKSQEKQETAPLLET